MQDETPVGESAAGSWTDRLKLWGGLALGLGLMSWFLGSLEWRSLIAVMSEVRWSWIGLAAILMLADYAVHAWRWRVLLHHVDPELDWRTLWAATTVLWGFNTLLPLRAGNFLRPAVVSLRRSIPYTTLLFTSIAEYVCDIFGIVLLILGMIWLIPEAMIAEGPLEDIKIWGTLSGVGALLSLLVVVLLSSRQARSVIELLLRPIPSDRVRARVLELFDQLVLGMAAVGHPLRLFQALALTLLIWGGWLLAILATFRAFDLEIPLVGALFWESSLTLSMLLPQAPGYLGVFQVVTEESLRLFEAPVAKAEAIALVFWTICFVPITVLGVYDGSRAGLSLGRNPLQGAMDELEPPTDPV